jgi:excisionase family DNA binding protein
MGEQPEIELFTVEEVAARFRVSRRTLQAFIREHPYYRTLGRRKLFTEADIARLYEALTCPSSLSGDTAVQTGTSAARSEASLWTKAQALLTEKPPQHAGGCRAVGSIRKQPPPSRFDSPSQRRPRLHAVADDLADLKSAAAEQGLTWQAAPKAKPKE